MLFKQILRDLKADWLQFLSVFLMSFLCLTVFSALISISTGMSKQTASFLKASKPSDLVLTAQSLPADKKKKIEKIAGVDYAEASLLMEGKIQVKETNDIKLLLTVFDQLTLDIPKTISGKKLLDSQDGIWLNADFLEHNKLKINDTLSITLFGKNIHLPIKGSILSTDHIYFPESTEVPYPNHKKQAYGYVSKNYLGSQLPSVPLESNQLRIKTKTTSNSPWIINQAQEILGDAYHQCVETTEQIGFKNFVGKQEQIEKLAILFPILFITLASLTMASTMKRFVQKQQVAIGTYKAMGFKNSEIYRHYLLFGLIITGTGSIIGMLLGPTVIAPLLITFLRKQYSIPLWKNHFSFSILVVTFLLVLCSMLMTLLPCRRLLQLSVANSLRVQEKGTTHPTKLEKSFFWQYFSFTNQWVARGILRNKGRSLMGIFGAFGCTVLLIAGLGIHRSIYYTVNKTFQETNQYEEHITFEHPLPTEEQQALTRLLPDTSFQWQDSQSIEIAQEHHATSKILTVLSNGSLLKLKTPANKKIKLNNLKKNNVILSEKLAKEMNLQVHDSLFLKRTTDSTFREFYVGAIVSISSPQGVIMNQRTYEKNYQRYLPNTLLMQDKLTSTQRKKLNKLAFVQTITTKEKEYQQSLLMLESITMIVFLILFVAILLGVVILSNFNLLIFSERFREFATLKVLGFKQSEIANLCFRENIFLTLIGLLLGFFGGYYFLNAYIQIISPENQQYFYSFTSRDYLLVTAIVLTCSITINLFLNRKIKRISMAESLKSNE